MRVLRLGMGQNLESGVALVPMPKLGGEGHYYSVPPFSCEPVTQVHIRAGETAQGRSLPGLVLRYYSAVGLYIGLNHKYGIVLG